MPKLLAVGEPVNVSGREATPSDVKSGLFYPHYRGLTGIIHKIYPDGTAIVLVDDLSLPEDVRERHQSGTQAMRQKWLDGLSEEARNRLSAGEKKFSLRYTILISIDDLQSTGTYGPVGDAVAETPGQQALEIDPPPPQRKSLAELEAEEARHLAEIGKKAAG